MGFALEGPTSITVLQGAQAVAIYRVHATSKPYRNVSLRVTGLPSGVSGGFSPLSGKPSFQSTLTLRASYGSATGMFTVIVTARDAKSSKSMPIVFRNVPGPNIPSPIPPQAPFTADVWVDITRPDDSGDGLTQATAKKTIGAGITVLNGLGGGKTMAIKEGEYPQRGFNNIVNGSSWSAPTIITNYPGHVVTIKPTGSSGSTAIFDFSTNCQFISIEGLIIDGTNQTLDAPSARLSTPHVRFVDTNWINNNGRGALFVGNGADDFRMTGGSVHGGAFDATGGGGGDYAYPFYLEADDGIVDGVEVYDCPSFAFHINDSNVNGTSNNHIIRNCVIHDAGELEAIASGSCALVIITDSSDSTLFYNNVLYGMATNVNGMSINGENGRYYNNTVYDGPAGGINNDNGTTNHYYNNISYSNGANFSNAGGATDIVTNSWQIGDPDPIFLSPGTGNFHLTASSPSGIRNGGTDLSATFTTDIEGTTRPTGAGTWSMGPYERA